MRSRFASTRYQECHEVLIGDVYKAFGTGPKGKDGTYYWLVVSITKSQYGGETHHMLGLDKNWNIVSTTSYGGHVMAERKLLFRIKNVEWFSLTKQRNDYERGSV